jgi:hypothetical protein
VTPGRKNEVPHGSNELAAVLILTFDAGTFDASGTLLAVQANFCGAMPAGGCP